MRFVSNDNVPLWSFYDRFKKKKLLLPAHQRGNVWPKEKKKKWYTDIKNHDRIPGVIITYMLSDESGSVFINDGANRVIHSLLELSDTLEREELRDLLSDCIITEQRLEYGSVQEAIDHFISLNNGTMATPYEVCNCILVGGLEHWEEHWNPLLEDLYRLFDQASVRVGVGSNKGREKEHKRKRDSLATFIRFVNGDKTTWSPAVSAKYVNIDVITKRRATLVEEIALKVFSEKKLDEIRRCLARFDRFLNESAALFQECWQIAGLSKSHVPKETLFRWWVAFAVYCKNNDISYGQLQKFTEALLRRTEGSGTLFYTNKNGQKQATNLSVSRLDKLQSVYKVLEIEPIVPRTPRVSRKRLRPGIVNSHVLAYSHSPSGESETVPENGLTNRGRGNRDMTAEELDRLRSIYEV